MSIVEHQDAILVKLENVRWFLARIKDIGDSIKEVSKQCTVSVEYHISDEMARFIPTLKGQPTLCFSYIM